MTFIAYWHPVSVFMPLIKLVSVLRQSPRALRNSWSFFFFKARCAGGTELLVGGRGSFRLDGWGTWTEAQLEILFPRLVAVDFSLGFFGAPAQLMGHYGCN